MRVPRHDNVRSPFEPNASGLIKIVAAFGVLTGCAAPGHPKMRPLPLAELTWKIPDDTLSTTVGPVGKAPAGSPVPDPFLISSQTFVVQLRDLSGAVVAQGSQMISPRAGESRWQPSAPYQVAYTINFPGRGTLYADCLEIAPPELGQIVRHVRTTGQPWTGRIEVRTTIGPNKDGSCEILAGSGEFAGIRGTFYKTHVITRADHAEQLSGFHGWTRYIFAIKR